MIGGALGEARGDLMPGFVEAALKTPYKLRVPLAPAEGLVLESQVSSYQHRCPIPVIIRRQPSSPPPVKCAQRIEVPASQQAVLSFLSRVG